MRVENPRLSLGASYDKTLKSLTLGIFTKSGIFDGFKSFLLTCQIAWSVNQLWLDLIIVLCKHVTNKSQVCRNGIEYISKVDKNKVNPYASL